MAEIQGAMNIQSTYCPTKRERIYHAKDQGIVYGDELIGGHERNPRTRRKILTRINSIKIWKS